MAERKLRTKRKRKYSGRAIRLSNELLNWIDSRRRGARSYDAFLRQYFGIPDWKGTPQPLVEGVLETTSGRFVLKVPAKIDPKRDTLPKCEAIANGMACMEAVSNKTRKVNKPIRMREIREDK